MVFKNKLTWVPIMLLCIPKNHMTQAKLWTDPILAHVGKIAAYLAAEHCEEGFRILSNFGRHGMQSQEHGHLHMIGGIHLGSTHNSSTISSSIYMDCLTSNVSGSTRC